MCDTWSVLPRACAEQFGWRQDLVSLTIIELIGMTLLEDAGSLRPVTAMEIGKGRAPLCYGSDIHSCRAVYVICVFKSVYIEKKLYVPLL